MAKKKWRPSQGKWGIFGQSKKSKEREKKYGSAAKDAQETAKKDDLKESMTTSLSTMQASAKEMMAPGGYFQEQQTDKMMTAGSDFRAKSNELRRSTDAGIAKSGFAGQNNAQTDYQAQQNIANQSRNQARILQESGKQRTEYMTGLQTQAQNMMTSYMGATDEPFESDNWDSFMEQYG